MSQIGTETPQQSAFSVHDLYNMAAKLISRHGADAEGIAGYFAEEHRILGDADRAKAWQAVQSLITDILSGEDFVPDAVGALISIMRVMFTANGKLNGFC